MRYRLLAGAALSAFGCLGQEESSASIKNPFTAPLDVSEGGRIFLSQCASCHGKDGRGGQGTPDLTTGRFRRASSDDGLYRVIAKGVPGTVMPGFNLAGREIWQTLAYVRSLHVNRAAELAKGDASKGAALVKTHGCMRCHSRNGEGGFTGPDLGGIGQQRTLAELRRSILDPQAEVSPDYWRIRAATRDGQSIAGIRLNEDTHSIQFLDSTGQLRSVVKSGLAKYELIRTSAMPSFREKLSDADLEDVVAYLISGGGR
ncbi:MAG: c-type cytochrome [Bryobacteraceae bacterium]